MPTLAASSGPSFLQARCCACMGNMTADSAGFESHSSHYSVFSPLQGHAATWYGFPPAVFDTALVHGLTKTAEWVSGMDR